MLRTEAEPPAGGRTFRRWMWFVALLALLTSMWLAASLGAGESLQARTTPPITHTGKRIRVLAPAGWEMDVQGSRFGFISMRPATRFPWVRVIAVRNWLRLDVTEPEASLQISVSAYSGVHFDGITDELDGIWMGWSCRKQDQYELTTRYYRTNKSAFASTSAGVLQSPTLVP